MDTVIVDDIPNPRVVAYILFRQEPDYRISYEESLLIRGINAKVYMVVASSVFSVFETDLSIPQFRVFHVKNITNDSYDLEEELMNASWIEIEAWTNKIKIETRQGESQ